MPGRNATILLVEDDSEDQEIILRVAQESGFSAKVDVVSSGNEAFDYLLKKRKQPAPHPGALPNLIFLDLNIPGMSGFDILTRLKAEPGFKGIPVIILSTSGAVDDINKSYALGASSYVMKPSSLHEFVEIMREIERYWLRTVSLPVLHA